VFGHSAGGAECVKGGALLRQERGEEPALYPRALDLGIDPARPGPLGRAVQKGGEAAQHLASLVPKTR